MVQVSVIMPVYNVEPYLEQCLRSVAQQTLQDFEVICVDDGSTDGSPEILARFVRADRRFRVITQEHDNAGVARNRGLEVALGEYLLFLDSDDYFHPRMFATMVASAKHDKAEVVVCQSRRLDAVTGEMKALRASHADHESPFAGRDIARDLFQFCVGWPWDKLFRRSFVEKHGFQFQSLRTSNDARFVYTALAQADRITVLEKSLVTHRQGNINSLEGSRETSYWCFADMMRAVREDLDQAGLYQKFQLSYLEWVINYSGWYYRSIDSATQAKVLELIRQEFIPLITAAPFSIDEISRDPFDRDTFRAFAKSDAELVAEYLVVIPDLRRQINRLELERDRARQRVLDMESSTAWRLGRAVTWLPRALKAQMQKRLTRPVEQFTEDQA